MNLLFILLTLPLLFSFKFNPMSQSLELSEGKKSAQFLVENDTAEKMAIELKVKERKMNVDGKEELPATSDLSIFPPQIIIPPKEKRTIRVLWNGPKNISSEKSYRVIAEQLPVDVMGKKKGTGIQIHMQYIAAFYVTPPEAESKLSVSLIESNNSEAKIHVKNSGTKHQIIVKPKLTFRKGDKKWTYTEKELIGFTGENVLSQSERNFTIKVKESIPSDAEVSLKLEQ